jgi:hypothetical protein
MASSHDQHDGAATAGHEDPQTFEDAHADTDDHGHDAHGHDSHDDHGEEGSRWVLIPLGIGAAIAVAVILALGGVQSDVPERTDPIGSTKSGEHGSTADDEHGEDADDEHEEESSPTTHE